MKILLINKFYFPFGGSETAFFQNERLLRQQGHDVIVFSMAHPKNRESRDSRHFVTRVDFEEMSTWREKVKGVRRILFGRDARARLDEFLDSEKPDIAHLHNIYHHLSPAIIATLKKHRVPLVMTLHDYKVVCPAYKLFRRGRICEKCHHGRWIQCLWNRCVKNSYLKSLVGVAEAVQHRRQYRRVDLFISPSRFLQTKIAAMGFGRPCVVIANFVELPPFSPPPAPTAPRVLYFGRLVEEKGIPLLIDAMSGVSAECLIVGDGPQEGSLRARAARTTQARIRFLKHQPASALNAIVRASSLVVVPSVWFENNPFAIIEAFALGVPVLAARIGGIPELVIDGETGLLFTAGDSADLRNKITRLLLHPELGNELVRKARVHLERHFSSARHGEKLLRLYRELIAKGPCP